VGELRWLRVVLGREWLVLLGEERRIGDGAGQWRDGPWFLKQGGNIDLYMEGEVEGNEHNRKVSKYNICKLEQNLNFIYIFTFQIRTKEGEERVGEM
jgi:hypothetical protein